MITTCTTCARNYEAGSEEQANEPTRDCPVCRAARKGVECRHDLQVSPSGNIAMCRLCGFVGRWRGGTWERVEEHTIQPPPPKQGHTPGPWMAERNFMASPHRCTGRIFGKVVHVASAHSVQGGDANAILIAAAPDMLQMLRDIDAHFAAHFGAQAWATSEIGGTTRVTIARATEVRP